MAASIEFVFSAEDERAFFQFLSKFELTVYPDRIPDDWAPFLATAQNASRLDGEGYYLAAENIGPILVRAVKRGKDRGTREIDESSSPVLHYERSVFDEKGELRSGKLWSGLEITGDVSRTTPYPDQFRRVWLAMYEHLVKMCRKSRPSGFLVGPGAARLHGSGTVLREAGRKGIVLAPYR